MILYVYILTNMFMDTVVSVMPFVEGIIDTTSKAVTTVTSVDVKPRQYPILGILVILWLIVYILIIYMFIYIRRPRVYRRKIRR